LLTITEPDSSLAAIDKPSGDKPKLAATAEAVAVIKARVNSP
jgi:hypothetical protein